MKPSKIRLFLIRLTAFIFRMALKLRYKITYKGLDKLTPDVFDHSGGILFLPNHPSVLVDPLVVGLPLYPKFNPRPLITEYLYYTPGVYQVMQLVRALPVPDFDQAPNSVKKRRNEEAFETVKTELEKGESFLIYPAGRTKQTALEIIGGASGVHNILQAVDANVVLVRITGLWGSVFSRAITGKAPAFWPTVSFAMKALVKSLIFFMPRRPVTVEYEPAPADFPFDAGRKEFNRWLERWYNRSPGISHDQPEFQGEPFIQVSYSIWTDEFLEPYEQKPTSEENFDINLVPQSVKDKICEQLAALAGRKAEDLKPEMTLAGDLALDSLDGAEIIGFLEDHFQVHGISPIELTTVGHVMGIAGGQIKPVRQFDSADFDEEKWMESISRPVVRIPEGETIPEVFLRSCKRMGKAAACADNMAGMLTYKDLQLRVILLAEKIRHLPGERIGILLPASVGASVTILACQLAGKVPVMINWTVGPRTIKSVVEVSGIEVALTAWNFINQLENVDLTGIDEQLIFLEDIRYSISFMDKMQALYRSWKPVRMIMRTFGLHKKTKDDLGGILFTSGTESTPKGVPLTHYNMLINQRGAMPMIKIYPHDVFLAMLPPFHSFGFTLTGVLPLLCGVKVAYSPNPTDGQRVAHDVGKWGVSILIGAPSFLKRLIQAATPEQLRRVRLVISGAEACPPELMDAIFDINDEVQYMEGYGATECAPFVTVNRPETEDTGVGIPGRFWEICIVHPETFKRLPDGERGLVLVSGPNVFSGYISLESIASPFVTIDGKKWYNTGDLGFIDEGGCLNLAGRQKRFVKIGGEMISLAAVEAALMEQAPDRGWLVSDEGPTLAVSAKEVPGERTQLHLFTLSDCTPDDANAALRDAGFSNLVRITDVHKLEEIPLMGTGKIHYRRMESQYLA